MDILGRRHRAVFFRTTTEPLGGRPKDYWLVLRGQSKPRLAGRGGMRFDDRERSLVCRCARTATTRHRVKSWRGTACGR